MRKAFATVLTFLMSGMLLAGCAGNPASDQGGKTEAVTEEEKASEGVTEEEKESQDVSRDEDKPEKKKRKIRKEESSEKKSLAQRMTGTYSYHYSDENGRDELYIMDVVPFGDNLYAFCGQAMPEDDEDPEAYTFRVSEFIPYDADEITSADGDTVTVNELRFSIMSNAGKYWDAGCKGTITLTDDGLVFKGFDNEGFLASDNGDSRLFSKDDRVQDAFSYLKDDNQGAPEELQGLWVQSGQDSDLYIEFSGSNMYIYRKDPDHEVYYAGGGCDFHDGSFDFVGNLIDSGGMPFEFTCEYKADGDELTIKAQDKDVTDLFSAREDYSRASDRGVHVTTMDEVELTSDSLGMYGSSQDYGELKSQDYFGVFVSSAKSPEDCSETINRLEEAGFSRSVIVYTPDFSNLNPEPYYSVTPGLYMSENSANEALSKVKAAGFTDAYVKNAGSYTGDRYWYTMNGSDRIDVLKDGLLLSGVSLTIPYPTVEESVTAYLLVTEDTVFDEAAVFESFGNYTMGDSPYEWMIKNYSLMNDNPDQYQAKGSPLSGVFEVGLENNKITTYYVCYWWD